jgi:hypothetical protein
MNNYGGFFSFVIEKICDLVLASNRINLPSGPNDDSHPKLKDRAPFPPDGPVENMPPVNQREAAAKRQASEKEFWETL